MKNINREKPIGLFDSGLGGISVLRNAVQMMPEEKFYYYGDSTNAPYGEKSREFIQERSLEIAEEMNRKGIKALVVACNTATSASIKLLRSHYPFPVIGMEPAIKPALHLYPSSRVYVMATPFTLREEKFQELVVNLKSKKKVHPIPCPGLVSLIEEYGPNHQITKLYLKKLFSENHVLDTDIVVLGCTHFVFLKHIIKEILPARCVLIDGNEGTIHQLIRKLYQSDLMKQNTSANSNCLSSLEVTGRVEFFNTKKGQIKKSWNLLLDE